MSRKARTFDKTLKQIIMKRMKFLINSEALDAYFVVYTDDKFLLVNRNFTIPRRNEEVKFRQPGNTYYVENVIYDLVSKDILVYCNLKNRLNANEAEELFHECTG